MQICTGKDEDCYRREDDWDSVNVPYCDDVLQRNQQCTLFCKTGGYVPDISTGRNGLSVQVSWAMA